VPSGDQPDQDSVEGVGAEGAGAVDPVRRRGARREADGWRGAGSPVSGREWSRQVTGSRLRQVRRFSRLGGDMASGGGDMLGGRSE